MKFADYLIPETLDEALTFLREKGDAAFPIAGATALQYLGDFPDKTAVDITRLGLDGIQRDGDVFRIGATTTLADVAAHREDGWVLHEVARMIPTQQIRNLSTVGGNIARVFPWSDLPLAFLVLDATVVLQGEETERMPAADFFHTQPRRLFKGGRIVTAVEIPVVDDRAGFAYKKESLTYMAFSMMSAAASFGIKDGRLRTVRLAVGGGVPAPARLPAAEQTLEGAPAEVSAFDEGLDIAVGEGTWKGKHGMSDDYAAVLARVVMKDVLTAALARAQGATHE